MPKGVLRTVGPKRCGKSQVEADSDCLNLAKERPDALERVVKAGPESSRLDNQAVR
jgi:hypothetical protein